MIYQASERLRNTCCLRAVANGKQDSVVGYSSATVIQTEEKRSPQKKIPQAIEVKIEKHVFYLHWWERKVFAAGRIGHYHFHRQAE